MIKGQNVGQVVIFLNIFKTPTNANTKTHAVVIPSSSYFGLTGVTEHSIICQFGFSGPISLRPTRSYLRLTNLLSRDSN